VRRHAVETRWAVEARGRESNKWYEPVLHEGPRAV